MSMNLPPNGGRFIPGAMLGEIEMEHRHRYCAAAALVAGKDVLDIASGEGYGAAQLARVARSVVGVDISAEAVALAQGAYGAQWSNLRYLQGACNKIPLADASVDAVVSFETIEHHAQHEEMMSELKRVLRPGGLLIISSPDRREYSDIPGYSNPSHVRELYLEEFRDLLQRWFGKVQLYGQRVYRGSSIFALEEGRHAGANHLLAGEDAQGQLATLAPMYFVALATDAQTLPELPVGLLASAQEEARLAALPGHLQQLNHRIALLEAAVGAKDARLAMLESSMVRRPAGRLRRLFRHLPNWRLPLSRTSRLIWRALAALPLPQRMRERLTINANKALIKASGVFDEAWYQAQNPDVANFPGGPLHHFMVHGIAEGRNPNPFFDIRMYLAERSDVAEQDTNPLVHYLRFGSGEGYPPSDRFDPAWYLVTNPDVAKVGIEPLSHFTVYGRKEGRKPLSKNQSQQFFAPVTKAALTCLKASQPQAEMALFVTHAPGEEIKPHVLAGAEALRREGIAVTLIVAADRENSVRTEAVIDQVDGLYVRENVGYDFAAWAHVARHVDLSRTQTLYLLNDSVVGPIDPRPFAKVMARLRASPAELIGLTDSHEDGTHHIQSYFLAAKGRAVEELVDYLHGVLSLSTKNEVIRTYETRLLSYFQERNYQTEVLFPNTQPGNATILRWRKLIADGFPFVKIAAIARSIDQDWRRPLAAAGWDLAMIEKSLAIVRQGSSSAIAHDLTKSGVKIFPIIPTCLSPAKNTGTHAVAQGLTVAVHLHLYYSDMLEAFAERLRAIPVAFDLYVSVPDSRSDTEAAAFSLVLRERLPLAGKIELAKVPNRGRDLAPLIAQFGRDLLKYDIVGHFHTKRSPHDPDLERWCDNILDLLLGPLGNGSAHVAHLFTLLKDDAKIVYPEGNTHIPKEKTGWGKNLPIAIDILRRYTNIPLDKFSRVEFSEGAMFWARSVAIQSFLKLPLSFDDFPSEPIATDGTLAHAVERLLFILATPEDGALIRLHKKDPVSDSQTYQNRQDHSAATSETI